MLLATTPSTPPSVVRTSSITTGEHVSRTALLGDTKATRSWYGGNARSRFFFSPYKKLNPTFW